MTFAATSENVSNPTYSYQIKIGTGAYAAAANPYTFSAAGSYTVKVEVRSNGAGEVLATAEQAITCSKYSLMENNHESNDKGSEVAVCSSTNGTTFTAAWNCPSAGTYYFYVTTNTDANAKNNCDYLNGSQTLADGVSKNAYLYGTSDYSASYTLNAPRAGEYTFTLTLNASEPHYFKCDYPVALDAEVYLNTLPAFAYIDANLTLATYVSSVNVVQPEYTFYVKKGEAAYGDAVTAYTFDATGEYTVKAEIREQGAGGDALDDIEKVINIYEPLTLYFVNKDDDWDNIHAYAYLDADHDIKNAEWTGEPMTNTGIESNHGHDVYSIVIPNGRYDIVIFNKNASGEGNQTADLTINAATPYYYNGAWYATLAECDPLPTVRMGGKFFSDTWADTENFAVDASGEFASITLNAVPEGDHEFKVVLGSDWRSTGGTFDRDHVSAVMTEDNQNNMILDADVAGNYTFRWIYATNTLEITYPAPPAYTVAFNGLESSYLINSEVTFSATSTGVTEPTYTYYVKQGEGEYGDAVASYTFAATGSYTVKVEVRDNGAGEALATAEKAVTVYEMITLYFINKDAWSTVAAYAYYGDGTIRNADWPGEVITATGDVTANHGYAVYSIEVVKDKYSTIIFNNNNNGSQTGNLTIDNARPYWYDGACYATLAECDQPVLTTDFYLVGNIMGWDPTETYRFMKATEDATVASTTLTLNEYSNIDFKLKEGDAWRGAVDANVVLYHDYNTVQITENADGNNIGLTPYAAGDYIFTLDLASRELTVTYPDGDPMPIPTNIFLAGTMNSWAPDNADYKFTVDNDLATLAVTLDAEADYQFKLVYNGSWYGANYNFNYYWNTDVDMVHEGDASHLYTFKAGTYTFRYQISTSTLTIGFAPTSPTDVTIGVHEYATLYSATALDVPNDVEAYIITSHEGIQLTMERIYRIPANTGVLLKGAAKDYQFYEGDGRYMDVNVSGNKLKGSVDEAPINNGLVHYVLSYDNDNHVGFFWPNGTGDGTGSFTNGAGKAYLELDSQTANVMARRGFPFIPASEIPTGLEIQELKVESGKMIMNGQLFIIRDGRIYNAQGARVK